MGLNSPIELTMTAAGLAAKENAESIIFTRFLAGADGAAGSSSVTNIKQVIPINNYTKRIAGQEYIQDGITQIPNESSLSISGFANSLDASEDYILNEIALMAKLDENSEEFCFAYDWSDAYKYRIRTDLSQPIIVHYKIILTRVPQITVNVSETGVTFTDLYSHTEKTVTQTPVHGLKCVDGVLTINDRALHKSTVGLGNVDNTSDLDKPVSTATQLAITGLSNRIDGISLSSLGGASSTDLSNHTGNTNNPHSVTYNQVGAAAASHTHTESDITDLGSYASSTHTHTTSDITDISDLATATGLNTYGVSSMSFDTSTNVLTLTMKDGNTKTVTIPASSGNSGLTVSSISYDDTTKNLIFTMSDNSEITCSLTSLVNQIITYEAPIKTHTYNSEWLERMTGSGTAADPYLIYTPRDFMKINDDMTAHYKLMNNLDFEALIGLNITINESLNSFTLSSSSEPWNCPLFNAGEGYRPIGYDGYFPLNGETKSTSTFSSSLAESSNLIYGTSAAALEYIFTGELDGNSKVIKGIRSCPENAYSVGLFSFVGNGASIHNLTIKDSIFIVADRYCQNYKDSSIASIAGDITYTDDNQDHPVDIHNIYSYATLISNRQTDGYDSENAKIGGICCRNNTSSSPGWVIKECSFRGKMMIIFPTVRHQVTGIAHYRNYGADTGRITNCINTCNLQGTYVQGIGQNLGKVNINCGLISKLNNSGTLYSLSGHRNTDYVNGKQFSVYGNLANDDSTDEGSNNGWNYYFYSADQLRSKSFIEEANGLMLRNVFAYNDLRVDNGWPLLADEYKTLVDYDGWTEIAVIDTSTNSVSPSGKTINDLLSYKDLDERQYNSEWIDRMTGSGTTIDPYLIYTPKDFTKINDDMTAHYKLMNNLDFAPVTGMKIEISNEGYEISTVDNTASLYHSGEGFWPIGYDGYFPLKGETKSTSTFTEVDWTGEILYGTSNAALASIFTGELDGNNKFIKGIICSPENTYSVGLFSFLGEGASVHNFTIKDSVFIVNDVYITAQKKSSVASVAGNLIYTTGASRNAVNIYNVYNYATIISNRSTEPSGSTDAVIAGIFGRLNPDSNPGYVVQECANHGELIIVNDTIKHLCSGIGYYKEYSNGNNKIINCINTANLHGYVVYGIGQNIGKANIQCGAMSKSHNDTNIYPITDQRSYSYIDGAQFVNNTVQSISNSTYTSNGNWGTYYKSTSELKSQTFIDETNALLPEPVFAYNDLNVNDGWPLLIDEYNTLIGVNGNLNLSLIDPTNNKVYKSGYPLERLQKTVTYREMNTEINGQFSAYVSTQLGGLKTITTTVATTDWAAEEESGTPTGNYLATVTATGITVASPVQLMTQLTNLEIEISEISSNSVTLIANSEPQSDIRIGIMFIP